MSGNKEEKVVEVEYKTVMIKKKCNNPLKVGFRCSNGCKVDSIPFSYYIHLLSLRICEMGWPFSTSLSHDGKCTLGFPDHTYNRLLLIFIIELWSTLNTFIFGYKFFDVSIFIHSCTFFLSGG